ncbi:hypothetical protein [Actinophytocola algeriensis]|uniref:Uncharacterized protein n=1 Tax=Actinophytocola algeriensis TaxID=1768010 RepID=A0A7W7Q9U7_9PSEU|nr:hypothetical protein [Actinophytocola algeriensis]MBB4909563.1 hypothetical protein [Actinophytocola algeriensis]MBE1475553.1 hypothetical protein [Actinophytocola algeriensis]
MHDVERHDNVARRENDNVQAREPLAAEPLPVDEAGLEPGKDTRPGQFPAQETAPAHDMTPDDRVRDTDTVRDTDMVRDKDTVPGNDTVLDNDAVHDNDTVRDRETTPGHDTELFTGDAVARFRDRWRELQADFVDDPERAMREADGVVDEVVRTITEHRQRLAGEWRGHTDTEHLRLAMREYRSFVDRLLPTT